MEEVTYDYKTCDRWWQPLLILLKPDTMHQRLKAIVQDQSKNNSKYFDNGASLIPFDLESDIISISVLSVFNFIIK